MIQTMYLGLPVAAANLADDDIGLTLPSLDTGLITCNSDLYQYQYQYQYHNQYHNIMISSCMYYLVLEA